MRQGVRGVALVPRLGATGAPVSNCGGEADRIMPTTFASMSQKGGYAQRVPFHHSGVRSEEPRKTIALVKPKDGCETCEASEA